MGKKLYVGNLSYNVNKAGLEDLFAEFGQVKDAEIVMDRETGRSKGFGFVEMSSEKEAKAAIAALSGKPHAGRTLATPFIVKKIHLSVTSLSSAKAPKAHLPVPDSGIESDSLESNIVRIALNGELKNAARIAIRRQRRQGLPVTFQRGEDVIRKYPNGREEILAHVPTPKYTLPKGVRIFPGK